jgi:hypothetical protein
MNVGRGSAKCAVGSRRTGRRGRETERRTSIVRPGGLIVIDDAWAPSVLTSVHYYERNLGWTVVPDAFPRATLTTVAADPRATPRCKAIRLPDPAFEPPFEEFHAF